MPVPGPPAVNPEARPKPSRKRRAGALAPMEWNIKRAPKASTTSPTLNTLARGRPRGTEKLSPRRPKCGWARLVEFMNLPGRRLSPAAAMATGEAGITPELAPMATKLARPPSPDSHSQGTLLLRTRKTTASA